MFNISFNVFDSYSETNARDVFSFSDTLNYGLCDAIGEKYIPNERYRWEDIFDIRLFIGGVYPKPLIPKGSMAAGVGYVFKEQDTAWAWREFWVPIKRSGSLSNIHLIRPSYRDDIYKAEHRYIMEEGPTTLNFVAPIREGSEYPDQYPPTLSIGDGPKRMFEFLFDSDNAYDDRPIKWLDHYKNGSGDEVYSKVTGNFDFDHDYNLLFDSKYSSNFAEAEEKGTVRIIGFDLFGGENKKAYNRGLICIMRRRDLLGFPYTTELGFMSLENELPKTDLDEIGMPYSWSADNDLTEIEFTGTIDASETMAIDTIVIEGIWGMYAPDKYVCKPVIHIKIVTPEEEEFSLKGFPGVSAKLAHVNEPEQYTLNLKQIITPYGMLFKRADKITITFSFIEGEGIALDLPSMVLANQYIDNAEDIYVFERKYIISTFEEQGDGPNPDTHEGVLLPRYGGGPFFPYQTSMFPNGYKAMNKMRGCWASEHFPWLDKEPLSIDITSMTQVERDRQQQEFEDTLSLDEVGADVLSFSAHTPPYFSTVSRLISTVSNPVNIQFFGMTFQSPTMKWEDYKAYHDLYTIFPHWKPAGHTWGWGPRIIRQNCMLFDVVRDTQQPVLKHLGNHKIFAAVDMMSPGESLRWGRLKFQLDRMLARGGINNSPDKVNRTIIGRGFYSGS